jgi:hypothetical protein
VGLTKDNVYEGGWHDVVSLNYLAMPLRKLPEAFSLASEKSWYPHLFNTSENIEYVGPIPDASYCGVDQMSNPERKGFSLLVRSQATRVI